MRTLYPALEPRQVLRLPVGSGHELHVEDCGAPGGIPVVFLHGGPGSSCKPYHRQFFDPARYRIVLFDQRGAGRSTPRGALEDNDTRALVADIERIRAALGIEAWVVFGGSWGATLALLYAQTHPSRVRALVLRGTFLARARDVDWFFGDGARRLYPAEWDRFATALAIEPGSDIIAACHARLLSGDAAERARIARAWSDWSGAVVAFSLASGDAGATAAVESMIADVTIEAHYAVHRYFLEPDQLLRDIGRVPRVPVHIIHGRRDLTCPIESSWAVHRALPRSTFTVLREAGHLASEAAMIDALVTTLDALAQELA
jgi:proline iminopeptidase